MVGRHARMYSRSVKRHMMEKSLEAEQTQRRQRRDARENRQQILAAAKRLFAAQGADRTSMHEIARSAGVGQGTLYRHFADKGELCHVLIKEDVAAFQERVGALISDAVAMPSPLARLDLLIVAKIELTESHLPMFAAIEDAAMGARHKKGFRGPFHGWLHEKIVTLLAEAVACGEVDAIDGPIVADVILAATSPQLYSFERRDLSYSSERIAAAMRHLFINGLRRGER